MTPEQKDIVISFRWFDTYDKGDNGKCINSDAFAEFIEAIGVGSVVVLAVRDDAFTGLNENAKVHLFSSTIKKRNLKSIN